MEARVVLAVLFGLGQVLCLPSVGHIQEPEMPEDEWFENRNPDFTSDGTPLFEGDMVLTEEQREGRQAVSNLWTSPVNYAITKSSSADRAIIQEAIDHWRKLTCIQFKEVSEGDKSPHISFAKDTGCWSNVGLTTRSGGQKISIGKGCARMGTVAHEMGHAMGLNHQQTRADRDKYVTIKSENILDGKGRNFDKITSTSTHGVPYDLTSNMHYGPFFFTKNGKRTIQTINVRYEGLIGKELGLSHRDQHIINIMYKCSAGCSSLPTCKNGGFVDKSCSCRCPPNTSGASCETRTGDYYQLPDCGADNMIKEGTITSPNYPGKKPINTECYWVITAPTGKHVKVTFTDMKILPRYENKKCVWDHISLRYKGSIYNDDMVACDDELKGKSFTSTDQKFVVAFKSGRQAIFRGFSASVQFV